MVSQARKVNLDNPERAIVCVDLNGVLDSYTGWKHAGHWDPPRPGAGAFLRSLTERGFDNRCLSHARAERSRPIPSAMFVATMCSSLPIGGVRPAGNRRTTKARCSATASHSSAHGSEHARPCRKSSDR